LLTWCSELEEESGRDAHRHQRLLPRFGGSAEESIYSTGVHARRRHAVSAQEEGTMDILFPRCAGIDIHKRTVVACRVVLTDDGEWLRETRCAGRLLHPL
jgi:hypothetical protein